MDGLRCPHICCKAVIRGVTGLDELMKLRAHFLREHGRRLEMDEAMEARQWAEETNDRESRERVER